MNLSQNLRQAFFAQSRILGIDMQVAEAERFQPSEWASLKRNAIQLAEALDSQQVKTIYVAYGSGVTLTPFKTGVGMYRDTPPATKAALASYKDLNFDLPLEPESLVAFKNFYSLHQEHRIAYYVRECNASTIILSGVYEGILPHRGQSCCLTETAHDFVHAGYDVIIAAEATHRGVCGSRDYKPFEQRKRFYDHLGAKLMTTPDIITMLDTKAFSTRRVPEPELKTFLRRPISTFGR